MTIGDSSDELAGEGSNRSVEVAETLVGDEGASLSGPPAGDRLERGKTVGRYVVLSAVGEGAMGVVYAAYDPELDRKVALKLLRAERASGPDSTAGRTRLVREAQAIAKLSHPNVVSIFDVGTVEIGGREQVFLAMEFVEGQSLGEWLERDAEDPATRWRDMLKILVEAGRGLAAAHAAGIVHRDFKPDNVLVGADGRARVVDFGLARRAASEDEATPIAEDELLRSISSSRGGQRLEATHAGALVGTPAYMAPELLEAKPADARTDQFAFCVTAFEAMYRMRPFRGDNLATLAFQISTGEIQPPPAGVKLPPRIRRAILRGLEVDPSRRFPSLVALLDELTRDPIARLRRVAGYAGLATVVLGLGYAGWAFTRPGEVDVAVRWRGAALQPAAVRIGDSSLEVHEAGATGTVAAGLHRLVVTAPDFVEHETLIEVTRGGRHAIEVNLEHEQGNFELDVEPPGATILVDGVDYGSKLRGVRVDTGEHTLHITREGHFEKTMHWLAELDATRSDFAYLPRAVIWSASATGINEDLLWIGDLTGDGREELIHKNFGALRAYDPWKDEQLWEVVLGETLGQLPAFGDLDGDGVLDIVAIRAVAQQRSLSAWSSRAHKRAPTPLWAHAVSGALDSELPLSTARPVLVDIDDDGDLEVVATTVWSRTVSAYDGRTGRELWRTSLDSEPWGLAVDARRDTAFVLAEDALLRLDLRRGTAIWSVPLPEVAPDQLEKQLRRLQGVATRGVNELEVADFDGDGSADALVPMEGRGSAESCAFSGVDGRRLWCTLGRPIPWNLYGSSLVEFTDDRTPDFVAQIAETAITLVDGRTGEQVWRRPGVAATLRRPSSDARPLILSATETGLDLVDPKDGGALASIELESTFLPHRSSFWDWDDDGNPELVAADGDRTLAIFGMKGVKEGSISLPIAASTIIRSGDKNGDGVEDLLIDAAGPTVIAGPKVLWRRTARDALRADLLVEDFDGDGKLEVGAFGQFGSKPTLQYFDAATGVMRPSSSPHSGVIRGGALVPSGRGQDVLVQCFRSRELQLLSGRDGSLLRSLKIGTAYGKPGYADVDLDGQPEIVVMPWEAGLLRVLDAASWEVEWTVPLEDGGWVEPRAVALDDETSLLLIAQNDAAFAAYDGKTGAKVWNRKLGPIRTDFPATIIDLEGDGVLEALLPDTEGRRDLLVLRLRDGEELRRIEKMGSKVPVEAIDVDADGRPELLVAPPEGGVSLLRADGTLVWHWEAVDDLDTPISIGSPMTISDLNGDGALEVLATFYDGSLRVLDARTGRLAWSFFTEQSRIEARPVAVDVDGDGLQEVFLAAYDRHLYALRGGR